MTDPIAGLWAQQHQDATPPSAADLARAGARLRRRILVRDLTEYIAGLVGVGAFLNIAVQTPDWGVRIACAAIILGTGLVMRNLWRRRPTALDAAFGAPGIAFHRAQLVAQRDMLASVWRWYLGPLVPGMVLFVLATTRASAEHMPLWTAIVGGGIAAAVVSVVFWAIHRLNLAAARRLQKIIDALDRGEI
jgi:hypothetical protein